MAKSSVRPLTVQSIRRCSFRGGVQSNWFHCNSYLDVCISDPIQLVYLSSHHDRAHHIEIQQTHVYSIVFFKLVVMKMPLAMCLQNPMNVAFFFHLNHARKNSI
jgi:hypothetical protein